MKIELKEKDVLVGKELLKVFEEKKEEDRVWITYYDLLYRLEGNNYLLDKEFYIKELSHRLGKLSRLCHDELDLPFISSIVVKEETIKPGSGFYEMLSGYGIKDKTKIDEEIIKKAQQHKDWSKLKEYLDKCKYI